MKTENASQFHHVLFVADKSTRDKELGDLLEAENFVIHYVSKYHDVITTIRHVKAEIIVLDITDNQLACLELCHVIRSDSQTRKVTIIMTSSRPSESLEIAAFRAGADDFILRPFRPAAFAERLKTRISEPKDSITVQSQMDGSSRIHIDRESYTAYSDNRQLNLSRKEFELLYLLASYPGKIFRREEVFEKIWRRKFASDNRTVDVHILRLRKKLGRDYIKTQKGVGYRFNV